MEIKLAAQEVARQMKNLKLAVPEAELRYLPTVATHTIESLPITFDKA
jgi:cytochrome P450